MMPDAIGFSRLRRTVERQGHRWDARDWGLNLVGIRAADGSARRRDSNYFNDWIAAAWYQAGRANLVMLPATTDPGAYWRTHPMNPKGTAILAPGRYPDMWRLGLHRGQYEALVQIGACIVYRDNDRDLQLDGQQIDHGVFGINLHRAADSYQRSAATEAAVDRWSAGCQVVPDSGDYGLLMALCRKHVRHHGNRIDYTLIEEQVLWIR